MFKKKKNCFDKEMKEKMTKKRGQHIMAIILFILLAREHVILL